MEDTVATLTEEQLYKKTPQEITTLLYQKCIADMEKAIVSIKDKEYMQANRLLQHCNDILYRLGAGIKYEAGIISDQLEALYDYIARNIIYANIKKDIQILEELLLLLNTIKDAWNQAVEKGVDNQNLVIRKKLLSYEQNDF